nr:response regulator [Lachnospiraceae bacterium]
MIKEELKIMLLEDEPEECNAVQDYVDTLENVTLTGCTANVSEALKLAETTCPDAIIVDLELHKGGGNGIQFLAEIKKLSFDNPPYLLVTTNNSSQTTHEAARNMGADFIMAKYEDDYSAKYVVDFLLMMNGIVTKTPAASNIIPISKAKTARSHESELNNFDMRSVIQEELNAVGISPKSVGYLYLTDAILLKTYDHEINIYSELGPKYRKNDSSIERSMQYAINRAWRVNDPEDLLKYYTARVHSERGVPTIMEFIYFYSTKLQTKYKIK